MDTHPTYSILVPTYNVAPWISDALDSVSAQTRADWECICVDDGSTDGTLDLLAARAARDPRVRVLARSHGGVSAARNAALDAARGDWILFLDGDDLLSPHLLASCSEALQRVPAADMVAFGVQVFDSPRLEFAPPPRPVPCTPRDTSGFLDRDAFGFYFYSRAYRRDLLADLRFEDFAPSEDAVFLMAATCRSRLQAALDLALYGYRTRPGSQVHSPVTPTRLIHLLEAVLASARVLHASGKTVAAPLARSLANDAAERFAREYATLPRAAHPGIRPRMRALFSQLAGLPVFSPFQRIRFRIFSRIPHAPAFFLLATSLERIKRLGLHR